MQSPLEGITVVEVASWMAAPSAAAILADMGATVVKVEPPGGDPVRGMIRPARQPGVDHPVDHSFQASNRGKLSITVDLESSGGQEVLARLISRADVFVTNMLPRRQARFGIDPDSTRRLNPRRVHATLTGFGTRGPDADRPGFDTSAFFSRSGMLDAMAGADGVPPGPRPAQGDHTAALSLSTAVLGALRLAESTGVGQDVEVSLLGTALWTLASDLAAVLVDGRQPTRRSRRELITPLTTTFACGDGRRVMLTMAEEKWWPRFCRAIDREVWLDDPELDSVRSRFRNMARLIDMIDEVLATRTRDEWAVVFDEHGLVWAPVSSYDEVVDDPQAEVLGAFPTVEHPAGSYRTVAAPFSIAGAHIRPRGRAPEAGEHTREILVEAGFAPEEIERLLAGGSIHQGEPPRS